MPDETGTEATRSDAPSVDESLFGDAVDDAAAAVAEEQDANEETAQDPQDADAAGEQAGQPEDLKVVLSIKGGRATIGVQRPSSDPHIETFDDPDLAGLTQEVLPVIERARAKWENEPKYPAHERPAPPARRRPQRAQGSGAGRGRRGRGGRPAAARDAEDVLGAGASALSDVRVGADSGTGAGERAGRRGALGRNTQGEVVTTSANGLFLRNHVCGFFAFQPDRPSMCAAFSVALLGARG